MSAPTMSRTGSGGGSTTRAMAAGPRAASRKNTAVCPSYLGAHVGRLTRLDACGRPVEGPESVVTFDSAVTLGFEPEVSEGEAVDTRNMAGNLCVSASTPDVLSGINVTIEFCAIDPAALQIMNPTWKIVRNAQGVITGVRIGETFSSQYGFALEVWPKTAGGGAGACEDDTEDEDPNDPSSLSGYFLLPWVNGRAPEEWEITGDELMTFTVAGRTRGGSPWGTGPYLVTRDEMGNPSPLLMPIENGQGSSGYRHPITNRPVTDPDHFHDDVTTVLPPAAGCGAHPLWRPDLNVSCTDSGVTVTVTNLDQISDPEDTDQQGRRPSVWVTWGDGSNRQDIANPVDENGNPTGTPGTLTHQYAVPTEHKITVEAPNGAYRIVRADPSATLEITPADVSRVEVAQSVQLQAVQTPGGGGDPVTVTADAEWTSSDPAIATVGNSTTAQRGRVTGIAPGTVTITAAYGCHTVERSITVVGPVQSISLDGPSEVTTGQTISLTATAHRQGGDTEDMTATAEWSSSNSAVATVNNAQSKGTVSGVAAGTATIRARVQTPSGQRMGEKQITVNAPVTTDSVAVSGAGSVTAGQTVDLTAEATMSDGTTQDVTSSATWSSDATGVATVSGGTVTGVSAGTAQITAASGGKTSPNHAVQVNPSVQSLAASPSTTSLNVDATQQITATATMSDSSTQDVTADATWESDNPGVATVGTGQNAGLITGVADGSTTVTATYGGRTAQVSVTVPAAAASTRKSTRT